MGKNYWIVKLRVSTLRKILRSKPSAAAHITYIETTKPAQILLRLLLKLKVLTAVIHKIKPRKVVAGPVLNMSSVRNDKGEVITLDVYRYLLDLRRELADRFFLAFKDFYFVKRQKKLNTLYAYFALCIARDINPAVYLAHFARWNRYEQNESKTGKPQDIMFLPSSEWSDLVAERLEKLVDRVEIDRPEVNRRGRKITVLKYVLQALFGYGFLRSLKLKKKDAAVPETDVSSSRPYNPQKVLAVYAMGLLKERRTDISYFHASDLEPSQLMIFFRYEGLLPSAEELEWLERNRIRCAANFSMPETVPGIPRWQSGQALKAFKRDFYGLFIKTVAQCSGRKDKARLWLLEKLWDMGMEVAYWKDFYLANAIGVIVYLNPSEDNFIPAAAISELGGFAMECERSIRFDYCTYIHNSPGHINFISGPYSLTQIPEPGFSLFTVQSSSINVGSEHAKIDGLEAAGEKGFIVSVFDETANDVFFGDSIRQLYEAMILLLERNDRVFLLIKTKKPQIIQKMPDIDEALNRYTEAGRCLRASWQVTATNASVNSHLVVSVPSTAAFEGVLSGTPTIVFNPMRCGSRIFYRNNGLNRRIFEDGETMVNAIDDFAKGKIKSPGDCNDIAAEVDPQTDGKGASRVGNYIKWCLEGLQKGLSQDEVLKEVNQRYTTAWGTDKITSDNSFEKKVAPRFRT
jgi:hypothetical protein